MRYSAVPWGTAVKPRFAQAALWRQSGEQLSPQLSFRSVATVTSFLFYLECQHLLCAENAAAVCVLRWDVGARVNNQCMCVPPPTQARRPACIHVRTLSLHLWKPLSKLRTVKVLTSHGQHSVTWMGAAEGPVSHSPLTA